MIYVTQWISRALDHYKGLEWRTRLAARGALFSEREINEAFAYLREHRTDPQKAVIKLRTKTVPKLMRALDDEYSGEKEYREIAKDFPPDCICADMLRKIADNEHEHQEMLKEIIKRIREM